MSSTLMSSTSSAPTRTRAPVTRRTLVRGAAWSTPVIALAAPAPAFAASCSTLYSGTMDWGSTTASTYTRTDAMNGTGVANVGTASSGGTVTVTVKSTFTNYAALGRDPDNLTVMSTVGGLGKAGLSFTQTAASSAVTGNNANNQTINIKFTKPVYNLSFTLTDLDYLADRYWDALAVTGATFTYTVPSGSTVIGIGSNSNATTATPGTAGPFRTSGTAAFNNNTESGGNVVVNMTGPVSSFNLVYWNLLSAPAGSPLSQGAWMAPMTFQTKNDGCP